MDVSESESSFGEPGGQFLYLCTHSSITGSPIVGVWVGCRSHLFPAREHVGPPASLLPERDSHSTKCSAAAALQKQRRETLFFTFFIVERIINNFVIAPGWWKGWKNGLPSKHPYTTKQCKT